MILIIYDKKRKKNTKSRKKNGVTTRLESNILTVICKLERDIKSPNFGTHLRMHLPLRRGKKILS